MPDAIDHADKLEPFLSLLRAKKHCLLMGLGDSNTCNASFTRGAKQWSELLHNMLRNGYQTQSVMLINSGVSGDDVTRVLDRWVMTVDRFRPDCTVLCLGSNDRRLTGEQFRDGLDAIIDGLLAIDSAVLLRTPTPILEFEPAPPHWWPEDEPLGRNVEIIRAVADRRALPLVDTYAEWWALEKSGRIVPGDIMYDAVHTNALGHQLVARGCAPAFGLPPTFHWE